MTNTTNTYPAEFIAEAASYGLSPEDFDQWGAPDEAAAQQAAEIAAEARNERALYGDF